MWIRTLDNRLINCDKVTHLEISQGQRTKETKPEGEYGWKPSVLKVISKVTAESGDGNYEVSYAAQDLVLTEDEEADKKALEEVYGNGYKVMEFVIDKIHAALFNRQAVLDMNDVKAELRSRKKESNDGTGEKDGTEKHCAEC